MAELWYSDVEGFLDAIFESIGDTLARGGRSEIRGFGSFTIRHREANAGRNPRIGATAEIPSRKARIFQTGNLLRARLNEER
jgi:integration host factor subunit beta